MTDVFEIEVKATNAKGETAIIFGEVRTQAAEPTGAAAEIMEAYAAKHGSNRVKILDPSR